MTYTLEGDSAFETLFGATRDGIRQSDPSDLRPRDWQRVSLALKDPRQRIIAGLYGATMWSWLSIEGLWVSDSLRGQGLGRRLLSAAEDLARQRRCIGVWLGTFDFQAKKFYERHGYTAFSKLEDFPPGHCHFHLSKRFDSRLTETQKPA